MIIGMGTRRPPCKHPEIEHVRKFVACAKSRVNEAWIYPPLEGYRYMVALALYSKCITIAEATLALLDAGFSDEAFGMTRTLVGIFITLRYIANKDTRLFTSRPLKTGRSKNESSLALAPSPSELGRLCAAAILARLFADILRRLPLGLLPYNQRRP